MSNYKFKLIPIEDLDFQLKNFKEDTIVGVTSVRDKVLIIYKLPSLTKFKKSKDLAWIEQVKEEIESESTTHD